MINLKDKVREAAKKEGFQKLRHNCAKVEVDKGHKVTSSGAQIVLEIFSSYTLVEDRKTLPRVVGSFLT